MASESAETKQSPSGWLGRDLLVLLAGAIIGLLGTAFRLAAKWGFLHFSSLLGVADAAGIPGWLAGGAAGGAMAAAAVFVTRRFAPEAAGSGIQEIEGTLAGTRPDLRWRRTLPVKFFGGLLSLSSGLLLGREGPTIHMGGSIGAALAERTGATRERMRLFIGAGAAAGLATAFGAPFAGILFALEELRREFPPTRTAIRSVAIATIAAVVVGILAAGSARLLPIPTTAAPTLAELALVVPFAIFVGAFGVVFNRALIRTADAYGAIARRAGWIAPACVVGTGIGALVWLFHDATGGGEELTARLIAAPPALGMLALLLAARFVLFHVSYATGVPGGIFAPQLAFGAVLGILFSDAVARLAPGAAHGHTNWALAGMAALIAATVRTPLTGLALVVEMTGNYPVLLLALAAAVLADVTAGKLGGRPIYDEILERTIAAGATRPKA